MKFYAKLADRLVKANAPGRFIAFSKVSNFSKASLNRNDAPSCEGTKKWPRRKVRRDLIMVGGSSGAVNRKRINFIARLRVEIFARGGFSSRLSLELDASRYGFIKFHCIRVWLLIRTIDLFSPSGVHKALHRRCERFTIVIRKPFNYRSDRFREMVLIK